MFVASVVLAAAFGAAVAIAFAPRSEATEAPVFSARAGAEIDALQRAEQSHYAKRGRYSERLADLFDRTRFGADIVMNAAAVHIALDVSTDGRTVIMRVDSPTVSLSRVLVRGEEAGRTCETLVRGLRVAVCP